MRIEPYLNFDGRCEEALEYYKRALGAEVIALMRFKDAPEGGCGPGGVVPPAEKIMHSSFRVGDSTVMASDCESQGKSNFQGISLCLHAANEGEAARLFAPLADGGQVQMPLEKTFFAKSFGLVTDKFGISWMIIAE